jgi:hypothetical protein
MNPDNGQLRATRRGEQMPEGFEEVPSELDVIARLKMARAEEQARLPGQAQVNLMSGSPLAKWAKKKRLEKIAAKSRRRNRHGKR